MNSPDRFTIFRTDRHKVWKPLSTKIQPPPTQIKRFIPENNQLHHKYAGQKIQQFIYNYTLRNWIETLDLGYARHWKSLAILGVTNSGVSIHQIGTM